MIIEVIQTKIKGVYLGRFRVFLDERGGVFETLRNDDILLTRIKKKIAQVYVATCLPNVVKAWHCHTKQYDNFRIIKGRAKIGLIDGRKNSPTFRISDYVVLDESSPYVLQIPPYVWHGQMALLSESHLLNMPTELYHHQKPDELRVNPETLLTPEGKKIPPFDKDFKFVWEVKNK